MVCFVRLYPKIFLLFNINNSMLTYFYKDNQTNQYFL